MSVRLPSRRLCNGVLLVVCTALLALTPAQSTGAERAHRAGVVPTGLHVAGNRIVDAEGRPIRVVGVNRAGTEYACIQGWGIFDGPTDDAAIAAIAAWHTNVVRIPLNEQCWLGINGVAPAYGGAAYQSAIRMFVERLNRHGLIAILDLHWSAPGTELATGQQPMPNRDHSVTFWTEVAQSYAENTAVIFDLHNEPFPDNMRDTSAAWTCWRDGGEGSACPGVPFAAAGMQELVNAIRRTGATNLIMVGGVRYANSLSKWLQYRPTDPLDNLAASWHVYVFNACAHEACFDEQIRPVANTVPIIAGEIGEDTCSGFFVGQVMKWLDSVDQGYLGWTWNPWDCKKGPALIVDYDGTPTDWFGRTFRDHLADLATSQN